MNMNNEKMNHIIDEAYKNYMNNWPTKIPRIGPCSKEEFINKIKTDDEFSKTWGLKIEERETLKQIDQTNPMLKGSTTLVPTKLITLTYKDTKFETYE